METVVFTDGLRLWGWMAGIAGAPMSARVLLGVFRGRREQVSLGPWAGLALLFFFLFLLVAGISIPVSSRVGDGALSPEVALVFWLFASLAGWFFNVALAPGKAWIIATSAMLLPATIAASALTYVP